MISGLYAVTPDGVDSGTLLDQVRAAIAGGARAVQLRGKDLTAAARSELARALANACHQRGALFIVNDDPDLARAVGADGVHVGEQDASIGHCRALLGAGAVIGASCYGDLARARRAVDAGASYVAFGSFFASLTKPAARPASVGLLHDAARVIAVPIVAIGGITIDNAAVLVEAGADAVAVISDLFGAPDIAARAREFSDLFIEETEE